MASNLPTNSGASIISAIPSLVQLFAGSGKTTSTSKTTSSKTASPDALNALTQILNSQGPSTDKAVSNAIDQIFRQSMPSIGAAERGSGIFNSSATKENVNQVAGIAAAKAAELDLAQQNQNTANKLSAAGTLGQLTSSTTDTATGTQKTAGQIDPLMAALGIGGAVIGSKLIKGLTSDASPSLGTNIDFTPTFKQPDLSNIFDISFESGAGKIAEGLKSATTNPITGEQTTGGGQDFLDVLTSVGSQGLLSGIGSAIGSIFNSDKVICTRMHELGYIDDATYAIDSIYGYYIQATNPQLVTWYHSWAIPFVTNWLHGRTLASKIMIQITRPLVLLWSAWMKSQVRKLVLAQGV